MATQKQLGKRMLLNVLHLGVGQIITTVLTICFSATVARALGASDFGLLYLITSITTFTFVIVDWGHGPYITREVARRPERAGELIGSATVVRAIMTVLAGVPAIALTWLLGYDSSTRTLAALMLVAWLPTTVGLSYSWVFRARDRMDYDASLSVILKSLNLVLALAFLAIGGRLMSLVVAFGIAGTATLGVALLLYRRMGMPRLRATRAIARELLFDGAPMLAINLAVAVQPYIDANLLFRMTSSSAAGWYGAAWTIAGTLIAPATILGAAMYPRLSRVAGDAPQFRATLRAAFRPLLLLAVLGAVGAYLFADFVVGLIYSERKYGPAADILQAFSPALMLIYIDMLFGYALLALGKAAQLAKAKVLAVVVTTAVELLLIPLFQAWFSNGAVGIVIAMACGELVMVTQAVLLIRETIQGGIVVDFLRGLAAGAATLLMMSSLDALRPVLAIPVCILTFLMMSGVVGLVKPSDVQLLSSMFRRTQPQRSVLATEG